MTQVEEKEVNPPLPAPSIDLRTCYALSRTGIQRLRSLVRAKEKTIAVDLEQHASRVWVTYVLCDSRQVDDCESILSTYSNIYNHPKTIVDSRNAFKVGSYLFPTPCPAKQVPACAFALRCPVVIDPKTGVPKLKSEIRDEERAER
eukprot:2613681-Rhodomonas_salina.1